MTYPELLATVQKYLLLQDTSVVKFILAVMVANRIPQLDPTFAFLVSNSSGGKSSLLEALKGIDNSFFVDDLTDKTFSSGMKRQEGSNSLLNFLMGKVMIMSDFTLMLDKDEKSAQHIMSQLRLIYDGKFHKFFGTGQQNHWEGKMGFLAGVTTAVYERTSQYAALGERMIYYYMHQPERKTVAKRALKNMADIPAGRAAMATAFGETFKHLEIPETLPDFEEEIIDNLIDISEMTTRARSSVSRKKYSKDNPITQVNALEMPMRMAKQLMNLGHAMRVINGGILTQEDYNILYKVALDSIPMTRKQVMEQMTSYQQTDIYGLAGTMGMPFETVKPVVEDLAALGVITKASGWGNGHYYYELKDEYRQIINKFQHIKMTSERLSGKNKDDAPLPTEAPLTKQEQQALQEAKLI